MTVAEMIRQTRTASNMTQEEYGAKLGVSRQTVSSWENGRSMPDLQMLIDICNIYHISLDKLLNEDNAFVNKIDFYGQIGKILKIVAMFLIVGSIIVAIAFGWWKRIEINKNETFANKTESYGFVLEAGVYCMQEADITYQLPNQKLPLFRKDFYVKTSSAFFEINDTEISINVYDNSKVFNITFNHNRTLEGSWTETGELNIIESNLNDKEKDLMNKNIDKIREVSERLLGIHNSIYSN